MEPSAQWSFEAIGTSWWIGVYQSQSTKQRAALRQAVAERIEAFDMTYSRFRSDSTVTAMAQRPGDYRLPSDSQPLFDMYRQLYDISDGLVTPLIGQVLSDAGYDANYSLKPGVMRSPPGWDEVMAYKHNMLSINQPLLLDVGAAGKGYLVDIVAAVLGSHGISRFCIDAAGDMLCRGLDEPLRIGLENPDQASQIIGVAHVQDAALCGSAGNRRAWAGYHHIINPQSLDSPRHIKALWVNAHTGLLADGLATALFFVDPRKLMAAFPFSYCMIYADGRVERSSGFPAELFTHKET